MKKYRYRKEYRVKLPDDILVGLLSQREFDAIKDLKAYMCISNDWRYLMCNIRTGPRSKSGSGNFIAPSVSKYLIDTNQYKKQLSHRIGKINNAGKNLDRNQKYWGPTYIKRNKFQHIRALNRKRSLFSKIKNMDNI